MDIDNEELNQVIDKEVDAESSNNDDSGEYEIQIGEPEEVVEGELSDHELDALPPIKQLRNAYKDAKRKNKELQQQLETLQQPLTNTHTPDVVEKPTLEGCGWDTEAHETALFDWMAYQQRQQQKILDERAKIEDAQKGWNGLVDKYRTEQAALKVKDFSDSEIEFTTAIDPERQGIVLKFAKEPAKLIYALGKNSTKLDELSKIKDPVEFALAMSEIERQITMTKRNEIPAPEKRPNFGSGAGSVLSIKMMLI